MASHSFLFLFSFSNLCYEERTNAADGTKETRDPKYRQKRMVKESVEITPRGEENDDYVYVWSKG